MRLLLVSHAFPPFNSVGAVRPAKLARHLGLHGHEVEVLTCAHQPYPPGLPLDLPASRVHYAPGRSIDAPLAWLRGGAARVARGGLAGGIAADSCLGRLGACYRTLLHWPDAHWGWVGAATRAGLSLLQRPGFDLIYATAPAYSALRVADRLARASGLPWVAELRDLWTDGHAYRQPAWRRALERRWENALLSSAQALVTVSQPLAQRLARFGKPVWEVRNGFDPEDFEDLVRPTGLIGEPDALDIAFTGNVYDGPYDVDSFCAGLSHYRAAGLRARVHVAGRNTGALRAAAQRHGVQGCFDFQPTLPRHRVLALQRHADVLLTFLWPAAGGAGLYSAKLFEYAGAGRPVLAVGELAGDAAHLIIRARLGRVCPDAAAVSQALVTLRRRKLAQGELRTRPREDFSRQRQFDLLEGRLADLLRGEV